MVLGRVRDAVNELVGSDDLEGGTVLPTDDDVVRGASGEAGVDRDRVAEITEAMQDVLDGMYDELVEESVPAGEDAGDDDGFLYAFDDHDDILVVGGAAGILEGVGERLGLSQKEIEAVRQCHRIAASRNGYARHVVMDDVVLARERVDEARSESARNENAQLAAAVERTVEDGYEMTDPGFVADLGLDEQKYFGVEVSVGDGVTLTFDPSDRGTPYHAVLAPEGTVRLTRSLAEALGIEGRDAAWSSEGGQLTARFPPTVDEVPGGRQTKIVQRDGWQGLVPGTVLDRADLGSGDDVSIYVDAYDGERLLVATKGDDGDGAPGAVAESGVGSSRTVLNLPESVADVIGLDRGNANVVWDVVDVRLVGTVML